MRFFVLIFACTCALAAKKMLRGSPASRAKHLNNAFMAAYRKSGIDGVQAYFDNNFYFKDFVGAHFTRAEYLDALRKGPKLVQLCWRSNGQQIAKLRKNPDGSANDLLIVEYYHFHVLYDLTFVEDNSLKGGYRWLKMEPAVN
ncbi:unnamed protein product [Caenorhabditis angaria]|uniref:SnoaL-like domain-containing protein n=1 Tax=Caenorhabditis angaria TaxID=860376 RepID=A0A9P1MXV8_9PELO|nr:unnamed protein product [Caenorhabditis angaria]